MTHYDTQGYNHTQEDSHLHVMGYLVPDRERRYRSPVAMKLSSMRRFHHKITMMTIIDLTNTRFELAIFNGGLCCIGSNISLRPKF